MKNTLLYAGALLSIFTLAYTSEDVTYRLRDKKVAYSFDFDDTLTQKGDPTLASLRTKDIASVVTLAKFFMFHPSEAWYCIYNFKELKRKGREIAKDNPDSLATIVQRVVEYAKSKGYLYKETEFTPLIPVILSLAVRPTPFLGMIDLLKDLKEQQVTMVGATNQTYVDALFYIQQLKDLHGVDLTHYFDRIITRDLPGSTIEIPDHFKGILVKAPKAKPHTEYYQVVKQQVLAINPDVETIVHIDDRSENVEDLESKVPGVIGYHMNLEGKKAYRHTKEFLAGKVQHLREAIFGKPEAATVKQAV